MVQRWRLTSSAFIIAVITTLLLPGPAAAGDNAEVESLRREVRQLQAQLHVLRTAVVEATELERQRSTNLAKQMRDSQASADAAPAPAPAPPVASAEPASGSREASAVPAAPAAADQPAARGKHRRHRHPSRAKAKSSRVQARD